MINKYYDKNVETEWKRLDDHWLEFETTYHHIIKNIPRGSKILDLGGGPGKYAFRLAQDGYSVFLADLSEKNIEFAENYSKTSGIKLLGTNVMDATNLSSISDCAYDAILCLGPFYHIENEELINKCIKELYRVVKPDGLIFAAFITNYAPLYDFIKRDPKSIITCKDMIERLYNTVWNKHNINPEEFYISFFADPEKIEGYFTENSINTKYIFGCEGIYNQSQNDLNLMEKELRDEWMLFSFNYSTTKIGIYNSEHIVYVGKK